MAQTDRLKKYLDTGVAFTHMTQQRAEEIVKELVKAGEVKKGQSQKRVEELLDRSRQTTEGLRALVESEVRTQVGKLGLVPKTELDEVKRELAKLKAEGTKTVVKKAPAAKKTPAAKKGPATKKTVATAPTAPTPPTPPTPTPAPPAAPPAAPPVGPTTD
jgi:polyhydroxyalkanoate synthesis regulator phasin